MASKYIKVIIPRFRVSYPKVFVPKPNKLKQGKLEYGVQALFAEGQDLSVLINAMREACIGSWGADKSQWPKRADGLPMRIPLRDQGDRVKKDDDGKEYLPEPYVAGAKWINLTVMADRGKPQVAGMHNNEFGKLEMLTEESAFYPGCYAIATATCFAYNKAGNVGVSFGLGNLQKVAEGEPLGGRTTAAQDFAPVAAAEGNVEAQDTDDIFANG